MVPVGQHMANLRRKGGLGKGAERTAQRAKQLAAIGKPRAVRTVSGAPELQQVPARRRAQAGRGRRRLRPDMAWACNARCITDSTNLYPRHHRKSERDARRCCTERVALDAFDAAAAPWREALEDLDEDVLA